MGYHARWTVEGGWRRRNVLQGGDSSAELWIFFFSFPLVNSSLERASIVSFRDM